MKELKYPYFKKDRILKIEMLENMRDFPRDMLDIYCFGLTDGIVCGFEPEVDKNKITFSEGITKFKGKVYLIGESVTLDYGETDSDVMIKLCFGEKIRDKDYETTPIDFIIDRDMKVSDNQQELGRFKLKKGAYLRSDYQDLYDFTTEYNTFNVVNVKYAGIEEPAINIDMLRYFAKEALNAVPKDIYDVSFCMQCLNSTRVEKSVIYSYLNYKLNENISYMSNKDIHNNLVNILDDIKRESSRKIRNRPFSDKIIVE
ncbi:MAG: DNA and RNA helicase [Clostridiales bacterium]|nr:DNA and RNA helicase [Clostridiales bacterium]